MQSRGDLLQRPLIFVVYVLWNNTCDRTKHAAEYIFNICMSKVILFVCLFVCVFCLKVTSDLNLKG